MSETLNIYQRLHAVMGEVDYIQKDVPKKGGLQDSFVSHDAVTAKVRPLLHKHGVIYFINNLDHGQDGNRTWVKINVTFVNIDDPREGLYVESLGYGVDAQDKGPGKAISYAVKYAILKTLCLETGDDPDEVQDERANHVSTRLGPTDFPREAGDPSARQSKAPFEILSDAMMKQGSWAELNKWWKASAKEIKQMNAQFQWDFFDKTVLRGLDLCQKKLEVELFWSFHEDRFKKLIAMDIVRYETLEEQMLNKVDKLNKREHEMAGE